MSVSCNYHTGAADYNSGPYEVTFIAGETEAMLDIQIIRDLVHEGNEFFTLIIMKSTLPNRVSRGSPGMTTVSIIDTTGMLITVK